MNTSIQNDLLDPAGWVSRQEAAELCGCSADTIKRRQAAGALPSARQEGLDNRWLIRVADLVIAGLLSGDRVASQAEAPVLAATHHAEPTAQPAGHDAVTALTDMIGILGQAMQQAAQLLQELSQSGGEL